MIEDKNPFDKPVVEPKANPFTKPAGEDLSNEGGATPGWVVAGFLALALIIISLLWASALGKVRQLEAVRSDLEQAKANLATALAVDKQNKDEIGNLQAEVDTLQKEKEMVGQKAKGLEDEMRSDLESKDVTISKLQGKLTVNILDRVMFNSGEAILKPDGEAVLRKIAAILAGHPELKIHVIGHTDNVPIRTRFASNWELSTARALAAVHFLTEKAGVDPHRVGAVGYGEYRPIADNATEEGRARNRRIAITILSDELVGADNAPLAKPIVVPVPQARVQPVVPVTPVAPAAPAAPDPNAKSPTD